MQQEGYRIIQMNFALLNLFRLFDVLRFIYRFKNKPNLSFDDASGMQADQEFELHPDRTGVLEYTTK